MQVRMTGPGGVHLGQVRSQVRVVHRLAGADIPGLFDSALGNTAARGAAMAIGRPRSSSVSWIDAGRPVLKSVLVWPSDAESGRLQLSKC